MFISDSLICEHPTPDEINAVMISVAAAYPRFSVFEIGKSIEARPILALRLGGGQRECLYVGAHHAMEWHTAVLLLRFAEELGRYAEQTLYGISIPYLLSTRSLTLVPLCNPDGVYLRHVGIREGDVLADRKRRMAVDGNFSRWQANARGVDLNHNYNAGFVAYKEIEARDGIMAGPTRYSGLYPESEPEVAAVAGLVRTLHPALLLTLHTQGEEIYAAGAERDMRIRRLGETLARLSGYRFCMPEGEHALFGGLADWAGGVLGIPAYTVECGKGENPLPATDIPEMYRRLRRLFFCAPVN